ncbi:hypothetical protein [Sporomusa acidovorans]|uniref:Uncharacterized protein n=1 Tax=Sporomusa acidovorans (strain ATCC 49682 / DSM 3132 / Mol) TaxID=1123286 RepID=A0ABZ3J0E4_SPOA4|nr:hypothetical protein [Sporomusa acidovorans]OZC22268.1 hypothetical protein SPACI_14760 [Sporomusa acidovorans DSM 3132]SDF34853.1 hypothetical protein SAMN04488499_10455 [Sporomusa acidovorans]
MEKNNLPKQHANYSRLNVPFDVHGTDVSAIGGASPEMTNLSQLAMKASRRQ